MAALCRRPDQQSAGPPAGSDGEVLDLARQKNDISYRGEEEEVSGETSPRQIHLYGVLAVALSNNVTYVVCSFSPRENDRGKKAQGRRRFCVLNLESIPDQYRELYPMPVFSAEASGPHLPEAITPSRVTVD